MRDHPPIHVVGPALVAMLSLTKHQLIDMLIESIPSEYPDDPEQLIRQIARLADQVIAQRHERPPNLVRIFEEEVGRRERRCMGISAQQARHASSEETTILRIFSNFTPGIPHAG